MVASQERVIRVVLADDHAVTREGIRKMLGVAADVQVVGEAQDGMEAMQLAAQLQPDILLLDLQMPGPRPAEVERWVRANCPHTETLVLTAHDRRSYLAEMIDAGAVGYLHKSTTSAERLIDAIRRAAKGAILFDAEQVEQAQRWRETVGAKWNRLTEREREIMTLIVHGKTDKEIAAQLSIKLKTVSNHVSSILEKLEMTSRTEAAVWAVQEGFIDAA
jgi:NarL family two-component system response regulator LiaR